jgi:4-hydroxy-tetrahydrodipicolinate synthase
MITGRHISRLSGYAPALPTPFDLSGNLDGSAFERLCERQIREGATALVVCGTTGEASTLSRAEHDAIVRMAIGVAQGRVPVVAGAGSNATSHAIELSRDAEAAGADALLSVVPYYNKPMQAGIYAHFRAIADAAGLPIILYDVPSRTVCGLADDTLARLAECSKFIGLKDATGDLARPARLRARLGSEFRLLSGDDATAAGFIEQGGNGCISVTSNVGPGLCRSMYLASKQGHTARARALAAAVAELTAALFRESNPVPVKYALSGMRLMSPAVRLPLVEASHDTKAEIDAVLAHVCEGYSGYMIGELARPKAGARGSCHVPADAALLRRPRPAIVQASMRSWGA